MSDPLDAVYFVLFFSNCFVMGIPVDGIDAACKVLHDGYTCGIMDMAAKGESCTPWDVDYASVA